MKARYKDSHRVNSQKDVSPSGIWDEVEATDIIEDISLTGLGVYHPASALVF